MMYVRYHIRVTFRFQQYACERNYKAECPIGFVQVGEIFSDGERCAADKKKYTGKCDDRTIKFAGLTDRAKQRWADVCGFQWPCRRCKKRFTDPCPVGWSTDLTKGEDSTLCLASAAYVGPCDRRHDFLLMNDESKQEWSLECHAYWPCL
jgi:CPW-WPC domain-containing protein